MVEFAGWSMPVQDGSIVDEHLATRTAAGMFDISHMGRLRFEGPGAAELLDYLLTRRVVGMQAGAIRYALVTNEQGGILDDVLVYHLAPPGQPPFFLLVVNAANRQKIREWLEPHLAEREGVRCDDQTESTAMIAVQGPRALALVQPLVPLPLASLRYYHGAATEVAGRAAVVSRTGYTGEDGCELILPAEAAVQVWTELAAPGKATPAGLGARDTLRLEAGMPLYGHELSEDLDPFQAGLGFAVQLRDRKFVGCEALGRLKADTHRPQRIGLVLEGRRVAREHDPVLAGEHRVGTVTSGTFSPTLQRPIAMAYVAPPACGETTFCVEVRGRREPARRVELPFYTRPEDQAS